MDKHRPTDWPEAARFVDEAGENLKRRSGDKLLRAADIQREVEQLGRFARGAIIPTDYCYNRINKAPYAFRYPVFEWVERGRFRYLGPHYHYTGPIMWKPAGAPERQVGEWKSGVCHLWEDPRMPDTVTLTKIADAIDTLADMMISDRTNNLAGYNASFWRDAALVLRQLGEEPPDKTDRKSPSVDLKSIFEKCLSDIGGESNEDVRWYNSRPSEVSRRSFFESATWAIWVGGMGRKGTMTFLTRAMQDGFSWDFATIGSWGDRHLEEFMEKLHGRPVRNRARGKWESIHSIARELSSYSTEEEFCASVFKRKLESKELDETDVQTLVEKGIPYIGETNARFIIRNMGGETIKYDRWLEAFRSHYGMSTFDLEAQLQERGIRPGLFDIVIWAYCEKNVRKVDRFGQHFEQHFGDAMK